MKREWKTRRSWSLGLMWRVRFPFPSVQKDSAKENFQTASISWGRSLRSVPNTNDGFDCCCHFVFPNFLVWKWSEEKKVVSKQCIVPFWQEFFQPRKWTTGIFHYCRKHFYKVSFSQKRVIHLIKSVKKCAHYCHKFDYCFWIIDS